MCGPDLSPARGKMLELAGRTRHKYHMTKKRPKRDWKAHLTATERKQFDALNRSIEQMDARMLALRAERNRIQNRASTRAVR